MGTRTRRTPLSRDRVLAAAVAVADTDGLEALTMRRLAAELGVEAMSLYHHLPGKNGLLDGLVDTVIGEIDHAISRVGGAEAAPDWRGEVRQRCLVAREIMLRHPWAPSLFGSRTTIPPGVYRHFERILATLIEGGFSYRLAHRALHALGSLALGFVQEPFSPAAAAVGADGAPSEAELAEMARMAEEMPHLAAMVAAESHANDTLTLGWCDSQIEFEFTLDLLLDGLARHLG